MSKIRFVHNDDLFESARSTNGMLTEVELLKWVEYRFHSNKYSVRLKSLEALKEWSFESRTGNLAHESGKFFRVEGLEINIKANSNRQWQQPIVNQPEIGILGFIAQKFNGILHLLVQAKMEPGNINFVQISPTVQATRSNYTQVHGGNRPAFIEYFLASNVGRVLVDQLQSEQGTRYLRKRNRNLIVEIPADLILSYPDDYAWITVGQLQRLMRFPNLVHMDCRSILGSLTYRLNDQQQRLCSVESQFKFCERICTSICANDVDLYSNMPRILSWMTELKCQVEVNIHSLPLNRLHGWSCYDGVIRHESGRFFTVLGVEVEASNREVDGWCQPLIQSVDGGIIGLATQMREGVLHFLIQGRIEPGLIDILELAPTVQCTPINYLGDARASLPDFISWFRPDTPFDVHFNSFLSDEGGRFYHSQQKHIVIELDVGVSVDLPNNYFWMTLNNIQKCAQFSGLINIELRSILSCLALVD